MFRACDTVHTIGEFGTVSQYLSKRQHIELNNDMTATLNQDWEIKPDQRFITARALMGSVIVVVYLSLEVYDCDPDIDNHAEQRSSVGFTHQSTLVPSLDSSDFWVGTMHQSEGKNISMKLIPGTYPFNALVTSSTHIDNLVDQPECGPSTVNFVVPQQSNLRYKIYLDSQSWSESLLLDNNSSLSSCSFDSLKHDFMKLVLTLRRIHHYSMDIYSSL
ncbi:hypothetical protein EDC94DRAFT_613571 [Helicostylum pulchrum]|nr:hypothetical protein EDC94DRAFT_613571 [Helicostylum pulchrum]